MKKKIIIMTLIALLVMPLTTFAEQKEYETKNFKETLASEDIKLENEDYKEDANQVTIYMFRGEGCTYCKSFLNFLNGISKEYGKYFKLESYEVWRDSKNSDLLEKVSNFIGEPAKGVPYIIIGEQVFPGYAENYDEQIKAAIKEEYAKKEKYNVMEEYEKELEKQEKAAFFSSGKFILGCNVILITIATVIIILFVNSKVNGLKSAIEELQRINNKAVKENREAKETHNNKENNKNKK